MKHIGIYTYLLVTIGIMTSCKENFVYDNPLGNRVIELTTEIGAKQPTTRVALSQKEDSYDMITTWQEGDQVQLVFQQDGHIYDAGTTTVYDITNGGKICKIRMSIPDEIDVTKPYLLTGITELKLIDDNGTLCCQSPMIRTRLADFKGRIMFQQELEPGGSRYVRFSNFGTYEVLHIKNTTAEPIQFEHCGFDAELKWYHGKETYRFTDSYDPTAYDYSYQSGDAKSTAFTIPAGSTETFVSWYIPSGGFISDASLKATINGLSITSSNKLSSSVPIEARKAYHMYATWDGKELKFGEDDETPIGDIEIQTFTVNGVSFEMVKVEGGTFMMGAADTDMDASGSEKPQHEVTLDTYYIGKTEVTQALWDAVMGETYLSDDSKATKPAMWLTWGNAREFVNRLGDITGYKFRLPTEAEWEFAARGGIYNKGYKYSGSNSLDEVGWYAGNSDNELHDIAMLKPNELGIFDMSGNVEEWCQDWGGNYRPEPQTNPLIDNLRSAPVRKGGSYEAGMEDCRPSCRFWGVIASSIFTGLRLAYSIEKDEPLVELQDNSPENVEMVSLSLPSGTLWANINLGAQKPEDYGSYFTWGEIAGYNADDAVRPYKFYDSTSRSYTKYGTINYEYIWTLLPEDDAATTAWGNAWRMPTKEEVEELIFNTTSYWTTVNGIYGLTFVGTNGNSIFLPASGEKSSKMNYVGQQGVYWSSTLTTSYNDRAHVLNFNSEGVYYVWDLSSRDRRCAFPIRPVYSLKDGSIEGGAGGGDKPDVPVSAGDDEGM